jgi:WD40 repeat protein
MKPILILILNIVIILHYDTSFGQVLKSKKTVENNKVIYNTVFGNGGKALAINDRKQINIYNTDSFTFKYSINARTYSMDFSNSSELLVFGNTDGQILLFEKNIQITYIPACKSKITCIKLSHSDKVVATSCDESIIKIWSLDSKNLVSEYNCKEGIITDIEFTLDDLYLIASTSSGQVLVWDYIHNNITEIFQSHKGWVRGLAICPDSLRFASCGDDRKIIIYSLARKDYYILEKSHQEMIMDIQFVNSNYLLSIGHDERIVLNNINLLTPDANMSSSKKNYNYSIKLNGLSGDKYPSNVSVSDNIKQIAVSTLGKGVVLTDYFNHFISEPHLIDIFGLDNKFTQNIKTRDNVYNTKRNSCLIDMKLSRPESIKNVWLHYLNNDSTIKITFDRRGVCKNKLVLLDKYNDYDIAIEDIDSQLDLVKYSFRVIKAD